MLKNLEKQKGIFLDYYIYEYTPLLEITSFYVVPFLDECSLFAVVWFLALIEKVMSKKMNHSCATAADNLVPLPF